MKKFIYIFGFMLVTLLTAGDLCAQVDRREVRSGNRDYKDGNWREAEIDYRKALVKDSLSLAGNYNLASALYREGSYEEAHKALERLKDIAPMTPAAADYFYNMGDVALARQDYKTAVDAFMQSLIRRPDDLAAKENFIYAKKKLEDQQNQQQNNDQNQQNDQDDQDQNDQDKEQEQKPDQNQEKKEEEPQQEPQQNEQPKITPQAAQQMLQAIQAKEKETQDKVQKEKAEALKSRQKEKNW
ncbi:MAG: tetratricopeptide repeat protein [Bacteroidales bacterium]|nr:tetratricopeptide repeat protein [Bacteroidales bacterium]